MTQRDPAPAGEPTPPNTPPNTGPANQPPPPPGSYAEEAAADRAAAQGSSREAAQAEASGSQPSSSQPSSSEGSSSGSSKAARVKGGADDPLRGSFTSHTWIAVIVLIIVVVLLAVFVLQNTEPATVTYFGFTGESPLAVALLIAFAAGLLVAGIAGTLRIWQLRRRVRKQAR